MTQTLAQLLQPQTPEEIFGDLINQYRINGFPVDSWQPFGTERTRLMAIATVLSDVSSQYVPQIAAGGFLDYAEALTSPDFLRILAEQNYNTPYNPANFTVGNIVLTLASGAGPYTINDGDLTCIFPLTGNRYICGGNGTKTLSSGTTPLTLFWASELAGAKYNDANNQTINLVTSLPGVTLSNPATTYSGVVHVGSGTGTLTLGGSPSLPHQVQIRIDSTGASGSAYWSTSIDGAPFSSQGHVASVTDLGGTGINITLVGAGGSSFVEKDTYTFQAPGSWITQQGSDDESSPNLADRCRNRWASLSPIPVTNLYELLATSTPTVGSQVTEVVVVPDAVINNRVNIVVAGPAGALPSGTISTIQTYISARAPITDLPVVVSPSTQSIAIAATITVQAAQYTTASNAIAAALIDYVLGVGINGTLRISAVYDVIMNVQGVIDVTYGSVTIDAGGGPVTSNVTLGSSTSFVLPGSPDLTALSYITT